MATRKPENTDPARLFQALVGAAHRGPEGDSTMFMYESGLTFPQIIVIYALVWHEPQAISVLAERLRLSLGATSQLVDRLVEAGYVARAEKPDDRRVKLVRLRPKGAQFMKRLNEIRRAELADAFDALPPPLRARLTEVLRDAVDVLGGSPDGDA